MAAEDVAAWAAMLLLEGVHLFGAGHYACLFPLSPPLADAQNWTP